jgi:hypothetical protein
VHLGISTYTFALYRIVEVTPVAVSEELEEQPEEQEVHKADEEVDEDLPECPDHRPSSFERGKPRSIFLPQFVNIFINALL